MLKVYKHTHTHTHTHPPTHTPTKKTYGYEFDGYYFNLYLPCSYSFKYNVFVEAQMVEFLINKEVFIHFNSVCIIVQDRTKRRSLKVTKDD